ncbi:RNA 2',3'-cyclic phosphodiesterase [Guptibacillus algicola]|uniref:RNA 2',3'-cyclic phosphodiesterase n=1 Tax=Guptibacillus algicola TaxID=225844 RepID=UPI001CD253FD|nr:RNA 2',3'-cyclic phosphodiesterase [Alkalihalobacillus algicola]MCA0986412.1 RNA 2',3'-cyclic phosphodiesterase [Alkalihalobacillus algicola]
MSNHYFIAISVERLHSELKTLQQSLDTSLFKHIVHPKDFHITLMFLGEATEEQLGDLRVRLKEITRNITPFEITPTSIGVFGKLSQPRVLYVEVEKSKSLEELHELVVESCAEAGFKKDTREYRPHITLAKKWKDPEKKIGRNMPEIKKKSHEIQSIGLFRVSPSDSPRYKCVERYDFKK